MTSDSARAKALADGRRADSARRRQRVIAAINRAITDGTEISVSAIARAAAVDRTYCREEAAVVTRELLRSAFREHSRSSPGGQLAWERGADAGEV